MSEVPAILAAIEELQAERAAQVEELKEAREVKKQAESDLKTYGATMGAAAKVDLAQTIRDAAKSIKKARDKIDKIDDKIKAQQTLLDLARQLDAAEAKAATAQEQAQAAAAEEVEHAQAAEQEPDDVKQKGHRKALRDAQRRRSAREREAADLTAKVADLADAVINFDPEQPSRPSRSKAPVKGPKLGTSSLIAIGAAMAVYLAFRKP